MDESCSRRERREMHTKFWSENLNARTHSKAKGVGGKIILEWILQKCVVMVWTGCIWLGIATIGWLL